eukprot:COSAG02_NODE_4562_length_5215_cov_2.705043_4_plen_92_part_00
MQRTQAPGSTRDLCATHNAVVAVLHHLCLQHQCGASVRGMGDHICRGVGTRAQERSPASSHGVLLVLHVVSDFNRGGLQLRFADDPNFRWL